MNKAAELSARLEKIDGEEGIQLIESCTESSLHSEVFENVLFIMHDDGSVNIIEIMDGGIVKGEVISAANILRVLNQYRPFNEAFKDHLQ